MSFSIRIKGSAAKELERIAKADRARLVEAIDRLSENPFLGNAVQHGELIVLVVRVVHRREVYRQRLR